MPNRAIGMPGMSEADLAQVDPRLLKFLTGWKITEMDGGQLVIIPDVIPINYYYDIRTPGEPGYDPNHANDEMELTLWCGWKGGPPDTGQYDAEVLINLRIQGPAVTDPTKNVVTAEITKQGSDSMIVYYNSKIVTNFTAPWPVSIPASGWFCKARNITITIPQQYIVAPNMFSFLQ